MPTRTGWVKRPYSTKGLDPIGVQAPCINIYAQLLPGITNVTDRARYYSFYPWMIWAFDQLPGNKSRRDLIHWVRRADCLFTLIGIRHRLKSNDDDSLKHDARLIGSQTLRPALASLKDGDSLDLSEYAVLGEGHPHRYFKNRLGGLGQYYIGTLDSVGLMGREGGEIGYTGTKGREMAEAFDSAVNRDAFVDAAQADVVTVDQLDALSAFCPCNLTSSTLEHDSLLDLFFDRSSEHGQAGLQRRQSLGLILDLVRCLEDGTSGAGVSFDDHRFRACAYTGSLIGEKDWKIPPKLHPTFDGWAVYQRNELLSVAIQCIFWAALRGLEDNVSNPHTIEGFMRWFGSTEWVAEAVSGIRANTFDEALAQKRIELSKLSAWELPEHEISMALKLQDLYRDDPEHEVRAEVLRLSAHIILSLLARDDPGRAPYDPITFPDDYFSIYPVNLESMRAKAHKKWKGIRLADWYGWLAGYWGIEAHMKVALRKLHYQTQDTFHVRPTDQGLQVEHLPDPTYTSPRFATAMQILQDLGAIDRRESGERVHITDLGEELRRFAVE